MGVTGAQAVVDPAVLEASVRDVLNLSAPRHMVVLDPVRITITNFPGDTPISVSVPDFPNELERGQHIITFDEVVYIEASDFKEVSCKILRKTMFITFVTFNMRDLFYLQNDEKGFRRFTPNQTVGLKHAGVVLTLKSIEKDATGKITNLIVKQDPVSDKNKPKAFIHWVSHPTLASVRLYERL